MIDMVTVSRVGERVATQITLFGAVIAEPQPTGTGAHSGGSGA